MTPRRAAARRSRGCRPAALALCALVLIGCAPDEPAARPTSAAFVQALDAEPAPPPGWALERKPERDDADHWVWVSPTGATAYGVVRFDTPLPVFANDFGHTMAFRMGYLPAFRKDQGGAEVLEKAWDEDRRGLRFVVEGGRYKVRALFVVRGRQGWSVYAGSDRTMPENPAELAEAKAAREATALPVD